MPTTIDVPNRATAQDRARYRAAAIAAVDTARATGRNVYTLMKQATGLPGDRCHGYITTAPNFSTDVFATRQPQATQTEHSGPIVRVRRQWNDDREAAYRIEDVSGLHWMWNPAASTRWLPSPSSTATSCATGCCPVNWRTRAHTVGDRTASRCAWSRRPTRPRCSSGFWRSPVPSRSAE